MSLLSDEVVKGVLGKDADVEIVFPKMHLLKMQTALQSIPLIFDLMPVVLNNKTQKDFIFSDNPVVFHNTYLNNAKGGVTGLQSPGLQIFCPLDDKTMLMMYDPRLYRIDMKDGYSFDVTNKDDIESINELQFINCDQNIFYSDRIHEPTIKQIHERTKHLVGKRRTAKRKIFLSDKDGKKRELLHFYEERPDYDLKLSFVEITPVSGEIPLVRDPKIVEKVKKDMEKHDKKFDS